ncbi:peroxiredoxin [Flavobacterium alvei]|uniref:thioredoxin-dependent peroxiredoxin n=1 Tax=Flavobacterium alvei TaxID=2080416 RepID=A0A2S4ZZB8_9FLAO|nr:peroxiredoxin [Flavobacterium alvei]POY35705.1 peroxiredoxin [Flavobacterium alvei]HQF48003.1 peroxiredoxin [Flavobacterium alvei]
MALQVGDKIPHFSVKDNVGNDFNSESIIGKKAVVIYFYPKDNTPGCTAQACSFRDQYQDFKDLGAEVIGISSDSVTSHEKFIQKYKLPFILLSDSDKKIRNLFGVKTNLFGLLPGRVTYVADQNGIIQMVFDSLSATKHIPKALEMIKKIV